MNYKDYRTLTINGVELHGADIVAYCAKSDIENVQLLGLFVEAWLSNDEYIEVYTSGSTGKPKLIPMAKNQMLASAAMTADYFGFEPNNTALLCLSMHYIAGKMMVVRALFSKLNLICIEPNSNPISSIPDDLTIDFVPFVPMQMMGIKQTKSIKKILLGGAPVDTQLEMHLATLNAEIYHGYGMTETLSHVAIRRVNGIDAAHIYFGLKDITFRQDENDCLVINIPFLDAPVHTRDVVTLLDEKSFVWKGRADNIVNSGGVKLFPEDIESKLATIIKDRFFVAGIPDEKLGEELYLFIEHTPYSNIKLAEIKRLMADILDKYALPRKICFVPTFIMTTSGKIQRKDTIHAYFLANKS